MENIRDDYLRGWVAIDDTKSLRIGRDDSGQLRVTVRQGRNGRVLVDDAVANWQARDAAAQPEAGSVRRLDRLIVELGEESMGTTYQLMFTVPNGDPAAFGGFEWRPVLADDSIERVRLFPEGGPSFYEAVIGPFDDWVEEQNDSERDSWIEPLSTYRPVLDP